MKNKVQIKFWGVRGSTPCANLHNMVYGGNTSCVQFIVPEIDEYLVADCGTGLRNLGNELNGDLDELKGRIFVTHPHWDHLQGFPFFKPFYSAKNSFEVYMPPQEDRGCKDILQGHLSNTFFPVAIDMLDAELNCITYQKEQQEFSYFSVDYMWAQHTVPTAMYKFKFGDSVVVFAPDNELPSHEDEKGQAFLKEFKAFVKGADVLIHDAQFDKVQHQDRLGWGHSDYETLLEVTEGLGIKHIILTHHDPDHDDDFLADLDKFISKEYADRTEEIYLAKEGQVINLP